MIQQDNLKIAIGSDHGGWILKQWICATFKTTGIDYIDLTPEYDSNDDYPLIAKDMSETLLSNTCTKGILICTSGIGMSIAANRFNGIRAALCYDKKSATMSRRHNDSNVLVLGTYIKEFETLWAIIYAWLINDGPDKKIDRHIRRITQLDNINCGVE